MTPLTVSRWLGPVQCWRHFLQPRWRKYIHHCWLRLFLAFHGFRREWCTQRRQHGICFCEFIVNMDTSLEKINRFAFQTTLAVGVRGKSKRTPWEHFAFSFFFLSLSPSLLNQLDERRWLSKFHWPVHAREVEICFRVEWIYLENLSKVLLCQIRWPVPEKGSQIVEWTFMSRPQTAPSDEKVNPVNVWARRAKMTKRRERGKEKRQAMERWTSTAGLSLKQIEQCERQSEWLHDFLSPDQ